MNAKADEKARAIFLREQGLTYSEILKEIRVAKSTLSLWFHDVGLAEHQWQRITEKRIQGQKKGALARRNQRVRLQEEIWSKAEAEIGQLSERELWLVGIALYWAEGSKEKEWRPGARLIFSNSDPRMIRVFLLWLKKIANVPEEHISFDIYIHDNKKEELGLVRKFWSEQTGFPLSGFDRVYLKKHKIHTKRKSVDFLYNGLLRVKIRSSSTLARKIEGWTRGIDRYCRLV
ncbi:MAG TPA: hypothetical protein VFQ72_00670 [Candidatus Paceibacterota bacterium]|nr:hypothetical protein [Candidatus Paceibacterota bacterium]